MSTGLRLDILEPALDADALGAFIAQLPGTRRREDGALLMLGERALVNVAASSVTIAFRWSDNRYGHAAAIGEWLLSRHRCRGVDIDYGSALADNAACARHLARTACVVPSSPERLRAAVSPLLVGGHIQRLTVDHADFVAHFSTGGGLRLPRVYAGIGGDDDDDALLLSLYERLDGVYPVKGADLGWQAALGLRWPDAQWRLDAVPDAPPEEPIWTVEDAQGRPVARGFAGGGAVCLGA